MSWGKIREELAEVLSEYEVEHLNEFQEGILNATRSGKNLLVEAHQGSGKENAVLLATLNKIEEPGEGSPRALLLFKDDQDARKAEEQIRSIAKRLDLTVDLVVEKGNMLQQRNDLFDGTEIIIGTPKRLHDIYIQNGFNIALLKLFVINDADIVLSGRYFGQVKRIAESLPKCQQILTGVNLNHARVQEYVEDFIPVYDSIEE